MVNSELETLMERMNSIGRPKSKSFDFRSVLEHGKKVRDWETKNPKLAAEYRKLSAKVEELERAESMAKNFGETEARAEISAKRAGVGEREWAAIRQKQPTKALSAADQWWSSGSTWFVVHGGVGSGKTIALCWLVCLANEGGEGAMLFSASSGPSLGLFDESSRRTVQRLKDVEVLCIDDLGAEMMTDVWRHNLEDIVNSRHSAMLRTAISTNLNPETLKSRYGDRFASRVGQSVTVFNAGSESLRKKIT